MQNNLFDEMLNLGRFSYPSSKIIFNPSSNIIKRFSNQSRNRLFGAGEDSNFETHYQAFEARLTNLDNKRKNLSDKDFYDALTRFRGLRMGFVHTSDSFKKFKNIILGKIDEAEEKFLPLYLDVLNDIGIKDEELIDSIIIYIKRNYFDMRVDQKIDSVFAVSCFNLHSFQRILPKDIMQDFLEMINKKLVKLSQKDLIKIIYSLSQQRVETKQLAEFFSKILKIEKFLSVEKLEINIPFLFTHIIVENQEFFKEVELYKVIEHCCNIHHIPYEIELSEFEFSMDNSGYIGLWDPLRFNSIAVFTRAFGKSRIEDKNLFSHVDSMIERKLEMDLIDLNSAALILHEGFKIVKPDLLSLIYQQINAVMENEITICSAQILPQNLPVLLSIIRQDLKNEYLDPKYIRNCGIGLLELIKEGDFDSHLENNLIINQVTQEIFRFKNLDLFSENLIEEAIENCEVMREEDIS